MTLINWLCLELFLCLYCLSITQIQLLFKQSFSQSGVLIKKLSSHCDEFNENCFYKQKPLFTTVGYQVTSHNEKFDLETSFFILIRAWLHKLFLCRHLIKKLAALECFPLLDEALNYWALRLKSIIDDCKEKLLINEDQDDETKIGINMHYWFYEMRNLCKNSFFPFQNFPRSWKTFLLHNRWDFFPLLSSRRNLFTCQWYRRRFNKTLNN